jgi:SAM-dependent methyltransferase
MSGRRRGFEPAWRRVEIRPVEIKAGRRTQVVRLDERQAHTSNLDDHEWGAAVEELLDLGFAHMHIDTIDEQVQLRVTKKGNVLFQRAKRVDLVEQVLVKHDRVKNRLLNPDISEVQQFLTAVGIADAHGRVKPSRQDKFRQIEEFVRLLDIAINDAVIAGALPSSSTEKPWQIVDLGCGNAYLTLAAYTFLALVRGEHVRVHGVDVREDSYLRNTQLARGLGVEEHVTFEAAYISEVADLSANVVLALHACDTATDDALALAVEMSAAVILASPCCHHDLQQQIGSRSPKPYDLITGSGILRQRFVDILTDSIRAELVRIAGYRVDVIEYVSDEHTNRNLMIRAIRTGAPPRRQDIESYDAMVEQWQVQPRLAELLADTIDSARERVLG